mgnify:CR=1 FL=1
MSLGPKITPEERLKRERQWAETGAKNTLNAQDWKLWGLMRSSHRFFAYVGQTLLMWRVKETGQADIFERLRVTDFEACPINGISVDVQTEDGTTYTIDHTPQQINEVFFYVPRYCALEFFSRTGEAEPTLRFGLVIRMKAKPDSKQADTNYVTTIHDLTLLFPKGAD